MNIIISNIYIITLLTYVGGKIFNFKDKRNIRVILKYVISILAISLINYAKISNITSIFIFIIIVCYALIQFKENKWFKIVLFVIYFEIIIALCETMIIFVFTNLLNITLENGYDNFQYLCALCLSNFLATIIIINFTAFYKRTFNTNQLLPYLIIFIFPVSTIILLFGINNYFVAVKDFTLVIILILSFIFNLISLYLITKYIENIEIKHELEIKKYKELHNQSKIEMMNKNYNDTFKLLHDILNKCDKINRQLNNNSKYEEIKKELKDLVEITFKQFNLLYTNSVALDYVINDKLDVIKEKDIEIETTIEECNLSFIEFSDQIDLFNAFIDAIINNKPVDDNKNRLYIKLKYINKVLILSVIYDFNFDAEKIIIQPIENIIKKYNITYSIINDNNSITKIVFAFIEI